MKFKIIIFLVICFFGASKIQAQVKNESDWSAWLQDSKYPVKARFYTNGTFIWLEMLAEKECKLTVTANSCYPAEKFGSNGYRTHTLKAHQVTTAMLNNKSHCKNGTWGWWFKNFKYITHYID